VRLLRYERGRARLTQVELAAHAGLHHNTVYFLEAGLRRPSTTVGVAHRTRARAPHRGTCTLRDAAAVDQRLRDAAGPSLRHSPARGAGGSVGVLVSGSRGASLRPAVYCVTGYTAHLLDRHPAPRILDPAEHLYDVQKNTAAPDHPIPPSQVRKYPH